MPITSNEGGTLYELDTVTSNEGGTLYELDTVHSNEGGTLYEIHSGVKFPKSLTWVYANSSSESPYTENDGYYVENRLTGRIYSPVNSNSFEVKGKVKITVSYSTGGSGAGGVNIVHNGTSTSIVSTNGSSTVTGEITVEDGTYYLSGGGLNSGKATSYSFTIAFTKV